ncbi:hypothetical protein PYCC9005_000907 [Savitreella phatthalungensis]
MLKHFKRQQSQQQQLGRKKQKQQHPDGPVRAGAGVPGVKDGRIGKSSSSASTGQSPGRPTKKVKAAPPLIPFAENDRVLFVGEGDFSFAHACMTHHLIPSGGGAGAGDSSCLATSLDSIDDLLAKYPDTVRPNLESIADVGGEVRHGIDATRLYDALTTTRKLPGVGGKKQQRNRRTRVPERCFDTIVFMFPHAAAGIADQDRNILTNQNLLSAFFAQARALMLLWSRYEAGRSYDTHAYDNDDDDDDDGEHPAEGKKVCMTLAEGPTYEKWDVRGLARAAGLRVQRTGTFRGDAFPGYTHQRTEGASVDNRTGSRRGFSGGLGEERAARWYIFEVAPARKPKSGANPTHR